MKAATLTSPQGIRKRPLRIGEVAMPEPKPGQVLLRVRVCGVCRTDLHIVEGDLPPCRPGIIPGHQIVGNVVAGTTGAGAMEDPPVGTRVGVSWMGGTNGTCRYCHLGMENLCDSPTFTGYTVDGGYAEYAVVRSDFTFPLPLQLDDLHAAPLLRAGIIGFRSLRVAGVKHGDRVGPSGNRGLAGMELRGVCLHARSDSSPVSSLSGSGFGWEVRLRNRPPNSIAL